MVSVSMITYNHEKHIGQAIEGVLNQKLEYPFELVIGEDCSQDHTRQIALDYQKRFPNQVRVITSPNNVGAPENCRRVMQACRGKYFAFCEGDDYWHNPHKLQRQVDFLESHPNYGVVHGDVRIHDVTTGSIQDGTSGNPENLKDDNAYLEILTGDRVIWTPTAFLLGHLYNTACAQNSELTDKRFLMGDFQTWLEISRVTWIKYIPEQFATRNELPESLSRSNNPRRMLEFVLSAKDVVEHYLRKYECPPALATRVQVKHTRCVLYYAFKALDRMEAARQYTALRNLQRAVGSKDLLFLIGSRSRLLQLAVKSIFRVIGGRQS